jgi:hypothetical protein
MQLGLMFVSNPIPNQFSVINDAGVAEYAEMRTLHPFRLAESAEGARSDRSNRCNFFCRNKHRYQTPTRSVSAVASLFQ